ncbi:hypothetical protein [Olsenella sp. An290]|uniref:hypothetical protein n=1 Tax=Olsenella sp. An290 TaxID=1965625 RepID=UPI000B37035C|nr:hypothetical protein [Olsenella sp. An290]OUO34240.1 hypothetical protein B5F84_07245 [Olsenella sp. An290]
MPDEPTGGPAPARRRRGLPPRESALVAIAFTLLVVSGVVYVQSIPSLLAADDQGASTAEKGEDPAEADQSQSGAAGDAAAPGSQAAPATEKDASAEKSPQPEKVKLPDVSLEGAHVEEKPSSPDTEDPKPDAPAADRPKPPTDDAPAGDTDDDTPDDDAGDDVFTSTPSAEEEAAFHAFLAGKASAIPGYVSQANACTSTFENACQSASLSARRANRDSCAALTQQLFSEYIAVRDYVRSNSSQYCDEQERLIGAYRCLMSYVDCYLDAWTVNVGYEDPTGHVGEFTAPLAACDGYLAEFHSYYDGLAL